MLCRSVVITGSNRGLGLEFVKQLSESKSPPKHVIAACRDPASAISLLELRNKFPQNVRVLQLDMKDESRYEKFKNEVDKIVGINGLNLLINNAGMSPRSTRISLVTRAQMEETFLVNAIGPLMLTKTLMPLLKLAASKSKEQSTSVKRAGVINISSVLGSIQENSTGGLYPYRTSKCALNAITKSLSLDLKSHNILVTSVHPGWVQTDMGGNRAPLTPQESISNIIQTISSLSEKENGAFVSNAGKELSY